MIQLMKKNLLIVFFSILGVTAANAQNTTASAASATQTEVGQDELSKFAQAFQRIQMANQEIQKKMMGIVKSNNLDVKTFNDIHTAKMKNEKSDASEETLANYDKAVAQIEGMQGDFQKKVEGIIKEQGLTLKRYGEIATELQNNKDLQDRLKKILMG